MEGQRGLEGQRGVERRRERTLVYSLSHAEEGAIASTCMLALEGGCSAWEGDSQDSVDGGVYVL